MLIYFIPTELLPFFFPYFESKVQRTNIRCTTGDEEEDDKEVGWKYIHGDVFRFPQNKSLFCAVMGTGTQLLTL